MKKSKEIIHDLWDAMKHTNIRINRLESKKYNKLATKKKQTQI